MHVSRLSLSVLVVLGCNMNTAEEDLSYETHTAESPSQDSNSDGTLPEQAGTQTNSRSAAPTEKDVDAQPDVSGNQSDSCGDPNQGLEPTDCTAGGDNASVCVYGHHCMCSEGYICDGESPLGENSHKCEPGVGCVLATELGNVGTEPDSCGDPNQGLEPTDCTAGGDTGSGCVYGNHCLCSEGYICDGESLLGENNYECEPGVGCIPDPGPGIVGAEADSCGAPSQGLEPIDCTAGGDMDAVCVFSNHCMCSEGYICDGPDLAGPECEPGVGCVAAE